MHAAEENRKEAFVHCIRTPSYNASSCHLLLNWKRQGNGIVALVISRNCTHLLHSRLLECFNLVAGPSYMAFEDECNFVAKFKAFCKSDADDDVLQVFFFVHLCIYNKTQLS